MNETKAFTQGVREGKIKHYSDFARKHIREVIEQTFPHFHRHSRPSDLTEYADAFVRQHHAIEPEFHQIATEFVRFMQHYSLKNPILLSVLEYEWVLFSVSILPDIILPSVPIFLDKSLESDYLVYLNPTLYCLEVPFLLSHQDLTLTHETTHFYGIFRNAKHEVHYKSLHQQERYWVQSIPETTTLTNLLKKTPPTSQDQLYTWLLQRHQDQFIIIKGNI